MLNTFEGQKKLLGGSLETLAIVLGEPFAQVFKPIVSAVVEVVNGLLGVLRQLPAPVKRAFAGFVVAAGAVIATVGAVIAVKAAIAILAIGLKVLGITAAGLVSTMLPAMAAVAVLGLVIAGVVYAVRNNLGDTSETPLNGSDRRTSVVWPPAGRVRSADQGHPVPRRRGRSVALQDRHSLSQDLPE
jgi:hypothetical protein